MISAQTRRVRREGIPLHTFRDGRADKTGNAVQARLAAGTTDSDRSASDALGKIGAGEGARTLDPDLGKVVLYH